MAAKTTAPSLEELLARVGVDDEGAALVTWARRRAAEILESTPADLIERVAGGAGIATTGHGPEQAAPAPPTARPPAPVAPHGSGEVVPVGSEAAEDEDEGDVEEIEEIEEFELLDDDELEILEEDDEDEGEGRAPVPPAPAGAPVGVAAPDTGQVPDDRDDAGHTAPSPADSSPSSTGAPLEPSPEAGETAKTVADTGHEAADDDDGDLFREEELDLDLSDM